MYQVTTLKWAYEVLITRYLLPTVLHEVLPEVLPQKKE